MPTEGGLIGGIFAMFAKPERAPADDLTVSKTGYEMRLAGPPSNADVDARAGKRAKLYGGWSRRARFVSHRQIRDGSATSVARPSSISTRIVCHDKSNSHHL
jgi:hypothetical protein